MAVEASGVSSPFAQYRFPPAIDKALAEHDAAMVHHANEIDYLRRRTDLLTEQFAAYAMRMDQEIERLRGLCEGVVHG